MTPDLQISVNWLALFSHENFQKGWSHASRGVPIDWDDGTHEYELGRNFAIESRCAPFPRDTREMAYILERCPAGVEEMLKSGIRIRVQDITEAIDGFAWFARELLGEAHTGSVTAGDTEHAGFRVGPVKYRKVHIPR